jgi:hypothetical protein
MLNVSVETKKEPLNKKCIFTSYKYTEEDGWFISNKRKGYIIKCSTEYPSVDNIKDDILKYEKRSTLPFVNIEIRNINEISKELAYALCRDKS